MPTDFATKENYYKKIFFFISFRTKHRSMASEAQDGSLMDININVKDQDFTLVNVLEKLCPWHQGSRWFFLYDTAVPEHLFG